MVSPVRILSQTAEGNARVPALVGRGFLVGVSANLKALTFRGIDGKFRARIPTALPAMDTTVDLNIERVVAPLVGIIFTAKEDVHGPALAPFWNGYFDVFHYKPSNLTWA